MISNFGGCYEDPFGFERRRAERVRTELRHASDRKLRAIVRAFSKLPSCRKYFVPICNQEYWLDKQLRESTARALLLGNLNWAKVERYEREEVDRKRKEIESEQRREELLKKGRAIEVFPGSLEEFERYKGHEYVIVGKNACLDSQCRLQYEEALIRLVEQGVEAFVRGSKDHFYREGIPVKKKS